MNLVNTLILSAAIIIAGFLIGGRYTVAGGAGGNLCLRQIPPATGNSDTGMASITFPKKDHPDYGQARLAPKHASAWSNRCWRAPYRAIG